MSNSLERIKKAASKETSKWMDDAKWRKANRNWLKKSSQIAVKVLREIRAQKAINGMTQKKLAEEMGVSPQYINKVLKGKENLTLETISKLEAILGITLISVPIGKSSMEYKNEQSMTTNLSSLRAKPIAQNTYSYKMECFTSNTDDYGQTG